MISATGSGKPTLLGAIFGLQKPGTGPVLLGAIFGLQKPGTGPVLLDGEDMTRTSPAGRGVGYVPQDGALFKTMTIAEPLAFAILLRRKSSAEIEARGQELAELRSIAHLLDRTPAGLSGGECQRVGLGRALSFRPRILLLDEPLSAFDDEKRAQILTVLEQVREHRNVRTLHVTHNRQEAEQLATQSLRIEKGPIVPKESKTVTG